MKIVIAGGTGFLGQPLTAELAADGHAVVVLTRKTGSGAISDSGNRHAGAQNDAAPGAISTGPGAVSPGQQNGSRPRLVGWDPDGTLGAWGREIDGAGAVINLAGESIAGKRWTAAHKARILDSRLHATRSLVTAIAAATVPPPVFVSGSAVGYYGPRGDEVVVEETAPGADFLADVCTKWEAEATKAASARTRVVVIRTGLVLERDGGALREMLLPFRFGAGGPLGSGRQYWPWIHRADWVAFVQWAVHTQDARGPFNVTGPTPVTNTAFARALGRVLRRPAFIPAPAFALRLALGEMADALLLSGQRAIPAAAERLGFAFRYKTVIEALSDIFGR